MTTRRALGALIAGSAILRLAFAASAGSYTNEAYYFLYARNLAWGYFDHPPMVGLVSALGLELARGFPPAFALRVGFILMFAASSWMMARLTARFFGADAGFLSVLALNATVFFGLVVGTLAGPDGPLLFFWLLTLERLAVAVDDPDRRATWLAVGLAWGGAMLSKYYAALLPVGAVLYLWLRPPARRCLRTPGPYLAAVTGLAVFSPVIGWNAVHAWASFSFQGSRAGAFEGVRPERLLEALVGQMLYLTPWIWAGLLGVLLRLVRRRPSSWTGPEAFLFCQAVPALALFLGVASFRRIMPHWPLVGFLALMPILGGRWAARMAAHPERTRRRLVAMGVFPIVLASLFALQARTGLFQDGKGRLLGSVWPVADPTVDTIRWDQIARELDRRGLLDEPGTFLFTDCWRFSAELAIALRREAPVACFHRDSRSFTFWSRPQDWVGRDGIFVRVDDAMADVEEYVPWFTRIEPLASFPIVRAGVAVQTVRLYRCVHQVAPFQFGYAGRGPVPRPAVRPDPGGERRIVTDRPASRTLR